jgi:hypothetical protein
MRHPISPLLLTLTLLVLPACGDPVQDGPEAATDAAQDTTVADDALDTAGPGEDAEVTADAAETLADTEDAADEADTAETEDTADAQETAAPVCTPDAVFCSPDGSQTLTCDATGQTATPKDACGFGCADGACLPPACDKDATRCAADDPKSVEKCQTDRKGWQKVEPACAEKCKDGACWVGVCTPGLTKCSADGLEQCKGNASGWDLVQPCPLGCTVGGDAIAGCNKCKPDELTCAPYAIWKCVNPLVGKQEFQKCGDAQLCASGACVPGVFLGKNASQEDNYLKLAKAFADCMLAKQDGSCGALDTLGSAEEPGITSGISANDLTKWFCDNKDALKAKFDSTAQFDAANDVMGCGLLNSRDLTFNVGISPGVAAAECYGFSSDGGWADNKKEVIVDACSAWP